MATSNSKSAAPKDEADDLFDNLTDGDKAGAAGSEDDFDDLLDEVEEDDSEGWVPTEKGEGISGRVVKVGETRSDFANEGENPMVPTVVVETKGGTKYRVIGFGAVLKRELLDADPHVGDMIAVKFFGEKPIRKGRFAGKPYKHFGVVVRRASSTA
jgi:hypothetical protein